MVSALLSASYFVYMALLISLAVISLWPESAKSKKRTKAFESFCSRWKNDPDFEDFYDRWCTWFTLCVTMGWFKS